MNAVAEVHAAFADLRLLCDPRGHPVLDALEELCVNNLERIGLLVGDNRLHSVRADRLPDIQGLDPDDPRSDGWYGRMVDMWDMRDRG